MVYTVLWICSVCTLHFQAIPMVCTCEMHSLAGFLYYVYIYIDIPGIVIGIVKLHGISK